MRKSYFILAVSLILVVAGFVVLSRRPGAAKPSPAQPVAAPHAVGKTDDAVPSATAARDLTAEEQRAPVNASRDSNTPPAMVPPRQTSTAVKNAEGLVAREIADLGDGHGAVERRFRYDADGQLTGETRLNPTTGQLIETVEYFRDNNGTAHTRITDAAGNITAIMPDGKIIRPAGTVTN